MPTFRADGLMIHPDSLTADELRAFLAANPHLAAAPACAPPRAVPCVHLGKATGGRVLCPSCSGKVELKLMACALHGECTPAKQAPGVACCLACPDYRARGG